MKRWLIALLLLLPGVASAAVTLTSDKLDAKAAFVNVKVDGAVVSDCGSVAQSCIAPLPGGGGNVIEYDITRFAGTGVDVTFEAQSCNGTGICSEWSEPYSADLTPPEIPSNLKIIVKVVIVTQ